MSTTRIEKRIVGYAVAKPEGAAANEPIPLPRPPDENPLEKRIERRPDGVLPSETNKIEFSTQEGRRRFYVTVSYAPVCGFRNGEEICIERPLEFFIPAGQTSGDHQWISATMRSLSLAARGGFAAKALADLRKVVWSKGPVRYGVTQAGKPRYHDSEVAAIAWGIQQMLHHRGFLDKHGDEYPLDTLVRRYRARQLRAAEADVTETAVAAPPARETPERMRLGVVGTCPKPDCRGDMVLKDNCPTCLDCGYSKCD